MASPGRENKKRTTGPWLWPVVLVIVGILLLLDNFLLIENFNAYTLLPMLLVIAGAQLLLRGDILPDTDARTFGITRGSVESGTLEISSSEIDIHVRSLRQEGRLIAGQYAANTRPDLVVDDNYAHLRMQRASTPWYSFADWHIAVAPDLPWQILASSHLGQAELDLEGLIVHDVVVGTGFGDIRFIAPLEALGQIFLRSTLGNIHINTPYGYNVHVIVEGGRFFSVNADANRYENPERHVYVAAEAHHDAPPIEIRVSGTFGDLYLA